MADTMIAQTSADRAGSQDFAVADYVALLKPRVMSLSVFTAFVGLSLAPSDLHPILMGVAIFCIALGAGASGAINMWYDRDIDAVMSRTRARPIPMGRIAPEAALAYGIILSMGAVTLLGLATNWLAAGLLGVTIAYYVVIYTMWLKRRTVQNIVVGGAAGALPPLVGWAAAAGEIGLAPVSLFLLIFFWTPPHFWALALYRNEDFARAGLPMLPSVKGAAVAKRHIFVYALLLLPLSTLPYAAGIAGPGYLVIALILGAVFVARAWQLLRTLEVDTGTGNGRQPHDGPAKTLFRFSILYLFVLFAALLIEPLMRSVIGLI